jgi:hypothetical protein
MVMLQPGLTGNSGKRLPQTDTFERETHQMQGVGNTMVVNL